MLKAVTLDYETYYEPRKGADGTPAYSLRNLTPIEYLHHPKFEMHCCGVVENDDAPFLLDGHDDVQRYLRGLRRRQELGERFMTIAHNALFDMCICAWVYGYMPSLMVDTMGMSRSLVNAFTGSVSLENVAAYLGLPPKGDGLSKVGGMSRAAIKEAGLWQTYGEYAMHDAWLCRQIFHKLKDRFPRSEYQIMHMVLRCAVLPGFQLDANLLAEHKAAIAAHKQSLLARAGVMDKRELMSNDKFAQCLLTLGIEPPMKTSPTTGEQTYAFAKSDPAMIDLAEHENPDVQALVAARVGTKSTLEETRTDKLLRIADITWRGNLGKGWMPIPLRYSGGHTHRLSGDWKLNSQNWPRDFIELDGKKTPGKLRRAHKAPKGRLVVKCDASQIEARVSAWLVGQHDLVQAFRDKRDIYSEFAEQEIYHRHVGKDTPDERFVGKNAILGLGFQVGAPKFKKELAAKSFVTLGHSIIMPLDQAANVVGAYRKRYDKYPEGWQWLQNIIPVMAREDSGQTFGPGGVLTFEHMAVLLPNGHRLFYPELRYNPNGKNGYGEWLYTSAKKTKSVYGGALFENAVQALARIITMSAAIRVEKAWPQYPLRHQVHDDLIYLPRENDAEEFAKHLEWEMSQSMDWYADLPLAAEKGIGLNYGDAK